TALKASALDVADGCSHHATSPLAFSGWNVAVVGRSRPRLRRATSPAQKSDFAPAALAAPPPSAPGHGPRRVTRRDTPAVLPPRPARWTSPTGAATMRP